MNFLTCKDANVLYNYCTSSISDTTVEKLYGKMTKTIRNELPLHGAAVFILDKKAGPSAPKINFGQNKIHESIMRMAQIVIEITYSHMTTVKNTEQD